MEMDSSKRSPLFGKNVEDLRLVRQDEYDRGFGDGYKQGYKAALKIFMALVDFKHLKEGEDIYETERNTNQDE
jgi:hypothetical protein